MDPGDIEVRRILDRAMVARLATISANGRPHANPLYFVVDGPRVHLGTGLDTLAARNVAANPAVQILFELERDAGDRRVLRLNGNAVLRTEPHILRKYRRRDGRKYFGAPRGWWMTLRHLRQMWLTRRYLSTSDPKAGHCVIEVEPTSAEILTPEACRR